MMYNPLFFVMSIAKGFSPATNIASLLPCK